jgi:hypothetical protein
MNPLAHLPKAFNELSDDQVMEVISAFADEGRYEQYTRGFRKTPKEHFEKHYFPFAVLVIFFNNWQN